MVSALRRRPGVFVRERGIRGATSGGKSAKNDTQSLNHDFSSLHVKDSARLRIMRASTKLTPKDYPDRIDRGGKLRDILDCPL